MLGTALRHQPAPGGGSGQPVTPGSWPVRLLNGEPSFINLLDALNSWQLVRERPACSAAPPPPRSNTSRRPAPPWPVRSTPSPPNCTGRRFGGRRSGLRVPARQGCDPKSSYGDFAAVSHPVDAELADLLRGLVCDGIIAPGFEPGAVATLGRKKQGRFLVIEADPAFVPPRQETREVFGLRLTQERDRYPAARLPVSDGRRLRVDRPRRGGPAAGPPYCARPSPTRSATCARAQVLGVGAGQQSRVDCTRLAGSKADTWWLRRHAPCGPWPSGPRSADRTRSTGRSDSSRVT